MNASTKMVIRPAVLAPAGNKASFLAAVAAEADAIYCGLKQFSARMEAHNFSVEELAALTELAHVQGTRVYVAVNTLIKLCAHSSSSSSNKTLETLSGLKSVAAAVTTTKGSQI